MRTRPRRWFTALLVAGLMLVGCASDDPDNVETSGGASGDTHSASPSGEAFTFDNAITIGVAQELTGDQAAFGQSNLAGYEAAFSEINRKGGVVVDGQRYRFEVASENSESDPATSFSIAQQFVEEDVLAVATSDYGFEAVYKLLRDNDVISHVGRSGLRDPQRPRGPRRQPAALQQPATAGPPHRQLVHPGHRCEPVAGQLRSPHRGTARPHG